MNCDKCACVSKVAGRLLFAVPMILFGIMHFMAGESMAAYVPSYVPGGVFWVYFTGLALVLAGVSIAINKVANIGAGLLGVLLLVFVFTMHLPNVLAGQDPMALGNLLKDVVMAGGAFYIAGTSGCKKMEDCKTMECNKTEGGCC